MPKRTTSNLFQRVVSALLLLPPVLGAVWAGGWWFAALLMLGGVLMAREWIKLTTSEHKGLPALFALIIIGLVGWSELAKPGIVQLLPTLIAISLLGAVLLKVFSFRLVGWFFVGVGYVGAPIVSLWWLRTVDSGLAVLWVFLIVWATDVGGYFFGKAIGGAKLAPSISPKKTWAGLIGGMVLTITASFVLQLLFPVWSSPAIPLIFAGFLAVWAQAGDLVESGIKRHFHVKDSGVLIPGHGGLLDRVDGLVFVAPAVATILWLLPGLIFAPVPQ